MTDPRGDQAVAAWQQRQAGGFASDWYLRHNQRRQEHLASLGLDLAGAQYLSIKRMLGFRTGRAIDRAQMELIAGRVSALNECFY